MKVIRAKHAGACYGVQRALDMAQVSVMDGGEAYTLGPLIHNPRVVSELESCGVHVAAGVDDIEAGIVIIRSHGVTAEVHAEVERRGLSVIDATCPHVARAQQAAEDLARQGCHVVVVGEAGHPEVEGLVSWARRAGGEVCVVADPSNVPADLEEPVGIVVQTTQTRESLDSVVDALHARGIEPEVRNTICFATRQRQNAAAKLAEQADAIVVIGGRNSSNTTRLAEICSAICENTHHVESADELDPVWFAGCETVGVTAGASTPEAHIEAVVAALEAL